LDRAQVLEQEWPTDDGNAEVGVTIASFGRERVPARDADARPQGRRDRLDAGDARAQAMTDHDHMGFFAMGSDEVLEPSVRFTERVRDARSAQPQHPFRHGQARVACLRGRQLTELNHVQGTYFTVENQTYLRS